MFDTGPLIYLDLLGYAPMLPKLHHVVVPPAVVQELVRRPDMPGASVPSLAWVEQRPCSVEMLQQVTGELAAGRGEREAIALALELSSLVVLDDRQARAFARRMGLRLTGTLGILLRLHRLSWTHRSLEADLAALHAGGMRLSPELKQRVLDLEQS